ncbi:LysR substrate-binding domain-containing protein [Mesorhizobium sp.]|uniref:LysR substrate-binding domain-containing protein n=1 Tax=Mesorhizobium sp. TaxID=1871066 RepID=UPI0025805EE9|nr:LysR substrate-binding domain-containing protein [Mesorhizobium sp.]
MFIQTISHRMIRQMLFSYSRHLEARSTWRRTLSNSFAWIRMQQWMCSGRWTTQILKVTTEHHPIRHPTSPLFGLTIDDVSDAIPKPPKLTTQFPRIAVERIATNRHLDIIRERVDFAFRVGTTTGQDLIVRRVSSIKWVIVAAPAYLAAGSPLRKPTDLLHLRCLVHDAQPEWVFLSDETPIVLWPPPAATSDPMGFLLQSSRAAERIALAQDLLDLPASDELSFHVWIPKRRAEGAALSRQGDPHYAANGNRGGTRRWRWRPSLLGCAPRL